MVISSLFKSEAGSECFLAGYDDDTRIVWFWLHEPTRLTDGHIALPAGGTPRVCVNWTTTGSSAAIAERAAFDEPAWRETVGLSEMEDSALTEIINALQLAVGDQSPREAFASAIDHAIGETEEDQTWQQLSDEVAFRAQSIAV